MRKKKEELVEWPDDPVVAEVRAIRAKMWKEGGGTVAGFLELVHRRTSGTPLPRKRAGTRRRKAANTKKSRAVK